MTSLEGWGSAIELHPRSEPSSRTGAPETAPAVLSRSSAMMQRISRRGALAEPANVTLVQSSPVYSYEDFFEGDRRPRW